MKTARRRGKTLKRSRSAEEYDGAETESYAGSQESAVPRRSGAMVKALGLTKLNKPGFSRSWRWGMIQ